MQTLINKLKLVEKLASRGKVGRLLNQPFKYILSVGYRKILYPVIKNGISVKATTFFDKEMQLILPAATDIYLTGGKSDPSEIRLAKFIIRHLKEGACFFDVGAHFGYYSLLAAKMVGDSGTVVSFEPSKRNYVVLQQNADSQKNIQLFNVAVSDVKSEMLFYEFPALYSEYNTIAVHQFQEEAWFTKYKPQTHTVPAIVLGQLIHDKGFHPSMIKIDVEGGEYGVIKGLVNYLSANNCFVAMEYLLREGKNDPHKKAAELLIQMGFSAFVITEDGALDQLNDIDVYIASLQGDSENIVFKKQQV